MLAKNVRHCREDEVEAEQLRLVFASTPVSTLTNLLVGALAMWMSWPTDQWNFVAVWWAVLAVVALARAGFSLAHQRRLLPLSQHGTKWGVIVGAAATGALWGSLSMLITPGSHGTYLILVPFVIGGMCAGAVATLSPLWQGGAAFLLLALAPLLVSLARLDRQLAWPMLAMAFVFLVAMLSTVRTLYVSTRHQIVQRLEGTRAQEAILEREKRFRTLVESATDAFFIHDLAGRFVDVNRRACESLGYSREELLSLRVEDVELRTASNALDDLWESIPENKTLQLEGLHRRKDGSAFPVEVNLSTLFWEGEKRILALARDISERGRLARLRREFVANVSHELRTPLTSIRGALSLLHNVDTLAPEEVEKLLHIARSNSERLLQLVNDLLDLEKLVSAGVSLDNVETDLLPRVERAVNDCAGFSIEVDVPIWLEMPKKRLLVRIDEIRFGQVLQNLLSNALRFSPKGVPVRVVVRREGEVALVEVIDRGPGVPPEARDLIFEPFGQVEGGARGGTGLGLAIASELIGRMGGSLGFESEPGVETNFFVKLPIEDLASESSA